MAKKGLSLVGHIDSQVTAHHYIKQNYKLPKYDWAHIDDLWKESRGRLTPPHPRAGRPELEILSEHQHPYLSQVRSNPRFGQTVQGSTRHGFAMVEIRPLIAPQLEIEVDRVSLPADADTRDGLLRLCLPLVADSTESVTPSQLHLADGPEAAYPSFGVTYAAADKNFRPVLREAGYLSGVEAHVLSVGLGSSSNLVQVLLVDGKSYCFNGYHRARLLLEAGIERIPAIVLARLSLGPGWPGNVMPMLREFPTMQQYVDGSAVEVELQPFRQALEVSVRFENRR